MITWYRDGLTLKAEKFQQRWPFRSLADIDMDTVQAWCSENDCGVRTSWDHFNFRNEQEISMFLLRWG